MTCAECLRYGKCARAWKGTPRDDCYLPGTESWGTCPGCGIMRLKSQAEVFPCTICAHKDMMSPEAWAKLKEKAAMHQAVVMENTV